VTPVLYSAAHAHFADTEPLGGGKAVADYLCRECSDWTVLSPRSLGIWNGGSLAALSESQYARFCRQFERAATAAILRHEPGNCVVLSNDISEGPDFAALGARGYRLATIFHVDVVEYFTKFYLRGLVRPETAAQWYRYRWLPGWLKLVFHKQAAAVQHSARLLVPSAPMKDLLQRCYPDCREDKITVLPWGNIAGKARPPGAPLPDVPNDLGVSSGRALPNGQFAIMTLSRLSPEKGIERLLAALRHVDGNVRVWICGGAAYMQGRRYERKLRRLADERVEFLGHVTGERKASLLARADLFVSPSRHESYGLTIEEALAAGCRVISHHHHGARGEVVDCGDPRALAAAINSAMATGRTQQPPITPAPSAAAARLVALLAGLRSPPRQAEA